MLGAELRIAAQYYMDDRGWLAMPLTLDSNGHPKRPIVPGWTDLVRCQATLDSLPWAEAKGLGIVLGVNSCCLAVLDIDSETLARAIWALWTPRPPMYAIRTVRRRMHLYLQETGWPPSDSSRFAVRWQGADVTIEFKSTGTQVAAPPTPGYTFIDDSLPEYGAIADYWMLLDARLRWAHPNDYTSVPPAEQPKPQAWAETVPEGARNDTLYLEAHKLREAGMAEQQALDVLLARVDLAYQSGDRIPEGEVRATVHSAYRKGEVPDGLSHTRPGEATLF